MVRSISRLTSTSWSEMRPSRRWKLPGMRPTAANFSRYSTVSGKKRLPGLRLGGGDDGGQHDVVAAAREHGGGGLAGDAAGLEGALGAEQAHGHAVGGWRWHGRPF